MPEFMINPNNLTSSSQSITGIHNRINSNAEQIERIKSQLALSSGSVFSIKTHLSTVSNQLADEAMKAARLAETLLTIKEYYRNAEDMIVNASGSVITDISSVITATPNPDVTGPVTNSGDTSKNQDTNSEDKEVWDFIKNILKFKDKFGDDSESGVLKDVMDYVESFYDFLNGDKKGLTGAGDLCGLTDSSIGLWSGLYDYFRDQYKGVHTGFFGDIANRNVKIMGLASSFIALGGEIMKASDRLGEKTWQTAVADYLDCGKELISTIKNGYKLKHLKDIKSLADLKAGPWSALGIYSAIGEAGIGVTSQGFRSYERYIADGKWTTEDTGATGIDVSMAGLYGLSHSLTFGLDDMIFGTVEKLSGGNGNSGLNYAQQAAEGYKILAKQIGTSIGNWWNNLTK